MISEIIFDILTQLTEYREGCNRPPAVQIWVLFLPVLDKPKIRIAIKILLFIDTSM